MAKISARGAHKVAEASRERTSPDGGWVYRDRLVVNSSGSILATCAMRRADESRFSPGGMRKVAAIKKGADIVAVFTRYAERRGFEVKS